MPKKRLDIFLAQQFAGGEHDSEGQFTVTDDEAIKKLSTMTLSDPEQWVLKIVQAGVAGKIMMLDFKRSRHGLTANFHGLSELPDFTHLRRLLHSTTLSAGTFLGELTIALRTLLFHSPFALTLRSGDTLWWDGKVFRTEQLEPNDADFRLWVMQKGWSVTAAHRHLKLMDLVHTRALYAPVTISFDTVPLNPIETLGEKLAERFSFGLHWSLPLAYASLSSPEASDFRSECLTVKARKRFKNRLKTPGFLMTYTDPTLDSQGAIDHFQSWVRYHIQLTTDKESELLIDPGQFTISYTRLGVICASSSFRSVVRAHLALNADHLRSDLSGLQLERPEGGIPAKPSTLKALKMLHLRLSEMILECEQTRTLSRNELKRGIIGTVSTLSVLTGACLMGGWLLPAALKIGVGSGLLVGGMSAGSGNKPLEPKEVKVLAEAVVKFSHDLEDPSFYSLAT